MKNTVTHGILTFGANVFFSVAAFAGFVLGDSWDTFTKNLEEIWGIY